MLKDIMERRNNRKTTMVARKAGKKELHRIKKEDINLSQDIFGNGMYFSEYGVWISHSNAAIAKSKLIFCGVAYSEDNPNFSQDIIVIDDNFYRLTKNARDFCVYRMMYLMEHRIQESKKKEADDIRISAIDYAADKMGSYENALRAFEELYEKAGIVGITPLSKKMRSHLVRRTFNELMGRPAK